LHLLSLLHLSRLALGLALLLLLVQGDQGKERLWSSQGAADESSPSELARVGGSVGEVGRDFFPAELERLLEMTQKQVIVGVPGRGRFSLVHVFVVVRHDGHHVHVLHLC
jgi:hypothetical protein